MKHSKFFIELMVVYKLLVVFFVVLVLNLLSNQVKAVEKEYFINKAETATATIDDKGTLTITGTGVIGEGIDKVRYVNGYQKDVGKNNISEEKICYISCTFNDV